MAHNLRRQVIEGKTYVEVNDLLKLIYEVMTMDGLHPEAVKALGGLGTGLALSLDVVTLDDLPRQVVSELQESRDGR
jgi:hypothetical protein